MRLVRLMRVTVTDSIKIASTYRYAEKLYAEKAVPPNMTQSIYSAAPRRYVTKILPSDIAP